MIPRQPGASFRQAPGQGACTHLSSACGSQSLAGLRRASNLQEMVKKSSGWGHCSSAPCSNQARYMRRLLALKCPQEHVLMHAGGQWCSAQLRADLRAVIRARVCAALHPVHAHEVAQAVLQDPNPKSGAGAQTASMAATPNAPAAQLINGLPVQCIPLCNAGPACLPRCGLHPIFASGRMRPGQWQVARQGVLSAWRPRTVSWPSCRYDRRLGT